LLGFHRIIDSQILRRFVITELDVAGLDTPYLTDAATTDSVSGEMPDSSIFRQRL